MNAPLVVASSLTATSGGVVVRPVSTPSTSETPEPAEESNPPNKKRRTDVLDFLTAQAERDEERHREEVKREEERERAASQRADKYLSLFEKLFDKI